ncbi:MAG: hypothetical protein E6344_17950 [Clostridium sp.]|nr:hypothetical protein [Clostridium sp.]MDU7085580.1 hypothetical protein [Clostridium sp.]
MFNYKFVKTPWICNHHAKYLRKYFLTYNALMLAIADIIIFLFSYIIISLNKFTELNGSLYITLILITLILEGAIFIFASTLEIKKSLDDLRDSALTLSFDEYGIHINSEGIIRHIQWDGVRGVRASKDELALYYKINGVSSNGFYFRFFEASREDILKEIEKYTKVRRVD